MLYLLQVLGVGYRLPAAPPHRHHRPFTHLEANLRTTSPQPEHRSDGPRSLPSTPTGTDAIRRAHQRRNSEDTPLPPPPLLIGRVEGMQATLESLRYEETLGTTDWRRSSTSSAKTNEEREGLAGGVSSTRKGKKCPYCSYETSVKSNMDKHVMTHSGERPFACLYCPFKAIQRTNLESHMRRHTGEKPFACSLCPYSTTRKSILKEHVRSKHASECVLQPFSSPTAET